MPADKVTVDVESLVMVAYLENDIVHTGLTQSEMCSTPRDFATVLILLARHIAEAFDLTEDDVFDIIEDARPFVPEHNTRELAMTESKNGNNPPPSERPKRGTAVALRDFEEFNTELQQRATEIATQLPSTLSRDKFINSVSAAVRQTPGLLKASPRSLFAAIIKSAQDGLLADGREGVITVYNTEVQKGQWEKVAQWMPMAYGLRKRARDLDDLIIDAQVVYGNDQFEWHQGDNPHIVHKPAQLGTSRGRFIGCYAIYRRADGHVLHREVMDHDQVQKVRSQSKAPNSLMWTKFPEEGYRKSVLRRGFKSVPCSDKLTRVVQRDDDFYQYDTDGPAATGPSGVAGRLPGPDKSAFNVKQIEHEINGDGEHHADDIQDGESRTVDNETPDETRDSDVRPDAGKDAVAEVDAKGLTADEAELLAELASDLGECTTPQDIDACKDIWSANVTDPSEAMANEAKRLLDLTVKRIGRRRNRRKSK